MLSWSFPSVSKNVFFVGQDLQELGREAIGPDRLAVGERTDCFLYFVPRRDIVQWSARGLRRKSSPTMGGSRVGDVVSAVYGTASPTAPGRGHRPTATDLPHL